MTDSSTAEVRDKGLLLLSQRFAAWLAAADVPLKRTLAIYESSAVLEFEVPARTRGQQQSIVQNPSGPVLTFASVSTGSFCEC
jgi:hypothetical protein